MRGVNGYNAYGELETEAISGLYVKTLTHHFDAYGRNVGYSVNGSRRTFLGYDGDTGRIAAMNEGGDFTLSTYVYANDLLGRRTSKNDEQYGYNVRDELISGQGLTYAYDDIGIYAPTSVSEVGNRTAAEGRTYAATPSGPNTMPTAIRPGS